MLADPAVADLKEDLLGDLGVPAALAPQFRSLGVNVARWLVPPSTLRQLTETTIDGALAYVRGDTPRLRVEVAVDGDRRARPRGDDPRGPRRCWRAPPSGP